jgi:hypothetical protein
MIIRARLFLLFLAGLVAAAAVGCSGSTTQEVIREGVGVTAVASETAQPTATLPPTDTAAPATATFTPLPTNVAFTPTPETEKPTGHLLWYEPAGIQKADVTGGASEYLVRAEDDWIDWGAHFAQNDKYLAYWVKHVDRTELWFTPLSEWQPESILEIEDVAYDFATPQWGVNDRYLLFKLSVLDTSGPLEDIKTIRTYIIDIETMELVNGPTWDFWEGDCSILARSPQTGQLALWCSPMPDQAGSQEYLVLEPEAMPWLTEQLPDSLIDDCLTRLICAWSQDDEWVAYAVESSNPDLLFYAAVDNPVPVNLDDGSTDSYVFPAWSPDKQFLYYSGACGDGTIQCPNVISVFDQTHIWRAWDNYNRGQFGNIFVDLVVWSPDSNYIAMPVLADIDSGVEQQVVIFDIRLQQEASRIINVDSVILDMVWVAD